MRIRDMAIRFGAMGLGRSAASSLVLALTVSLLLTGFLPAAADTGSKKKSALTEEQKIIHLLNRIGFGPRPGDLERVKRMGIDKYIDQQLKPERIDDSAIQAKLAGFESLRLSTSQLYDKYPAPQFVARELGLRPGQGQPGNPQASPDDQREYRQQMNAYYQEKGLKPPAALVAGASSAKDHPSRLQ